MIFEVHTQETVHGVYTILADSEDDARSKLENASSDSLKDVHQRVYEAWDMEIESIKEVKR